MIDLWAEDDKDQKDEYINSGSQDFKAIPHDTRAVAYIEKVMWDNGKNFKNNEIEENYISMQFCIESGEHEKRRIFKKFWLESENVDLAKKDWAMFKAVDFNCGGKVMSLKRKPSSDELADALLNKSLTLVIGLFVSKKDDKEINYLMGISSNAKPKPTPKPTPKPKYGEDLDEDSIPFN